MLTSLWYVSWKKQKCLQLCCKKLFPIIGLNVCKTCVLEVSPKSVWQLFHFFYLNLCEYFQRNFVEISSIFDDNNALQSKQKNVGVYEDTHFRWDNKVNTLQTVIRPASNLYKKDARSCHIVDNSLRWNWWKVKLDCLVDHNSTFHVRVKT